MLLAQFGTLLLKEDHDSVSYSGLILLGFAMPVVTGLLILNGGLLLIISAGSHEPNGSRALQVGRLVGALVGVASIAIGADHLYALLL